MSDQMQGVAISTVFRLDNGSAVNLGTVSRALGKDGGGSTAAADVVPVVIPPSELETMMSRARSLATLAATATTAASKSTAAPMRMRPRRSAKSNSIRFVQGGKSIEIAYIADPRGGDRPPTSATTFVDGRPVKSTRYVFEKRNGQYRPTRASSVMLDSIGRPVALVESNFDGVNFQTASGALGASMKQHGAGALFQAVGRLVLPDVANAQAASYDEAGPCTREQILYEAAMLGWGAAGAALTLAWLECVGTIVGCPAVWIAQGVLAAADLALGVAFGDLQKCQKKALQPCGSVTSVAPTGGMKPSFDCYDGGDDGGGSGGGGGDDSYECVTTDWEASYDGGVTWVYLGSTVDCGQLI